jgi:hypothetical protein
LQTLKKNLSKKRTTKSGKSESVISNSDDVFSERTPSVSRSTQLKKASSSKPPSKPELKVPESLRLSYQRLIDCKNEAFKIVKSIASEIDFNSIERGILMGQFSTPEEVDCSIKQIFNVVIRKHNNFETMTNLLKRCLTTEETKKEVELPKLSSVTENKTQTPNTSSKPPEIPRQAESPAQPGKHIIN